MIGSVIDRTKESEPPTTFGDVIRRQRRLGGKIAFSDPSREVSFAEFDDRVNRLADALRSRGLQAGDRIALLGRNSISLLEYIGTMKAGLIPVPLNWRLSTQELSVLIHDCSPKALVCDMEGAIVADQMALALMPLRVCVDGDRQGWLNHEDLIRAGSKGEAHLVLDADDTALLVYTSGTTGAPKGAMITHGGLLANCVASAERAIEVDETDVILCAMPMFHVGGLCYYLLAAFAAGSTSILRPAFDAADVVASLERFAITNVHLVPTMIADLIAQDGAAAAARSLRRIVYAGSSMPLALLHRAMNTFSEVRFSQSYGSTEGGLISCLSPDDHALASASREQAHLLQSCGNVIAGCEIRVDNNEGREAAEGQLGEVLVRSPRMMKGYWKSPDKTASVMRGAWLCTGDIGYRDAAGYLYLVDRKNDMIVTGGENVFPSEVEQILLLHPDVSEAAVFGLPDDRWVEKVVAAVVLRGGSTVTDASLIAFTKRQLASYKCPKEIFVLAKLPTTGVGKISRKILKDQVRSL